MRALVITGIILANIICLFHYIKPVVSNMDIKTHDKVAYIERAAK